jgi:tol-pal system protein YbgF
MKAAAFSISVRSLGVAIALGIAGLASTAPARAQDVQSLAETVTRLERQLQTLERNIYRGGGAPAVASPGAPAGAATSPAAPAPAGAAQLNIRIGEIEEQLRQVTGNVERVGFEVRQLSSRLDKLVTDVDFRLRSLEQGAPASGATQAMDAPTDGAAPADQTQEAKPGQPGTLGTLSESQLRAAGGGSSAAAPAPGTVASAAPAGQAAASTGTINLPAGDSSSQYEYAFSYLMRRDFPGAEEAFRQFVAANPNDPLAGNAQYWLGETYYARNDFPAAARTFAEGFQRYPDSGKAADNLLKLGLSLAALERKDDACITFAKLSTAYPGAPANILQRARRERDRLGCG